MPSFLPAILTVPKARGPVAAGGDFLVAVEHELDRGAGLAGQLGGGDALDVGAELAAEPAAHVVGDALDLGRRHARTGRPARPAVPTVACVEAQTVSPPSCVPLGDEAVRFQALVQMTGTP